MLRTLLHPAACTALLRNPIASSLFFLKQAASLHQLCPRGAWPPIGDLLGWEGGGWRSGKDGGRSNGFVAGEDYHLL